MQSRSWSAGAGSLVRIGHRPPEPAVGGSNPSPPANFQAPILRLSKTHVGRGAPPGVSKRKNQREKATFKSKDGKGGSKNQDDHKLDDLPCVD